MKISIFLFSLLSFYSHLSFANGIAVVGSPDIKSPLTADELKNIFLQNGGRLANGIAVKPLDLREDDASRELFYKLVVQKSRAQVKAYWAQLIFTGRGLPPQIVESAEDLINLLRKKETNYIAYLPNEKLPPGQRVLFNINTDAGKDSQ